MKKLLYLNGFMKMFAVAKAEIVITLCLTGSAAMAVAPGQENGSNDVYWDDSSTPSGIVGQVNATVRDTAGNLYIGGRSFVLINHLSLMISSMTPPGYIPVTGGYCR